MFLTVLGLHLEQYSKSYSPLGLLVCKKKFTVTGIFFIFSFILENNNHLNLFKFCLQGDLQRFVYNEPCLGPALPLCCPLHRDQTQMADTTTKLQLGFCTVVCKEKLICTHECGLGCHFPKVNEHNKRCIVKLQSPCVKHPKQLNCCDVMKTNFRSINNESTSINEALELYR